MANFLKDYTPLGLINKLLSPNTDTSQEDAAAEKYLKKSVDAFEGVKTPNLSDINYDQLADLGDYQPTSFINAPTIDAGQDTQYQGVDPRLAELERVSGTDFDNIKVDPRLQNEQYDSLAALDDIIQGGGLTAADKAQLNKVQSDAAQADKGRRDAILQNMQSRGMGGSGMELLSQLQSSQAATDRQNQAGLDVAGMAQQRALDAIMQSGQLAGGMRDQDFGQQSEVAQARDAISQFNANNANSMNQANAQAANQMGLANANSQLANSQYNRNMGFDAQRANAANTMAAQQTNAQTANQAAQANQQRRQELANQNTGIRNQQRDANSGLQQQRFDNQAGLAQNKAAAAQPGVDYYQGLGDRKVKKEAAEQEALLKAGITGAKYAAGGV